MRYLLIFLVVFSAFDSWAKISTPSEWETLLKSNDVSLVITRLNDSAVLFEKDPNKLLSPASVTKIATSVTALKKFTPNHMFRTKLYYTGKRNASQIQGDLLVKGGGDPLLTSEKLWQVAADIRNLGISEFTGDIVIDDSLFEDSQRDASRVSGALASEHAYDAPISALAINFNTVALSVAPNPNLKQPAYVSIDPYPLGNITIQNKTNTSTSSAKKIQITRTSNGEKTLFLAEGLISQNAEIYKIYRSIDNTVDINGEYLRSFLNSAGVKVHGKVKSGKIPSNATQLIVIEGYPVSRIVHGLNKYSNNYVADTLVKDLGASFNSKGTLQSGVTYINKFLREEVGIKDNFQLPSGSGLDHTTRFSAQQIDKILNYAYKDMIIFPEFLASLAVAGVDGSLEKRFIMGPAKAMQGKLRAKTGTLTQPLSTSAIAGYYQHPKHGLLAFSLICNAKNNMKTSQAEQRALIDDSITKILLAL